MNRFRIAISVISLIFSFSEGGAVAESVEVFYVLDVKGSVRLEGREESLKIGDSFKTLPEESKVFFGSPDAFAKVLSPRKGICWLEPQEKKQRKGKEKAIVCVFKRCFFPSERDAITRGGTDRTFADEKQMKEETAFLISMLRKSKKSPEEIENQVLTFLREVYGESDADKARKWLKANLSNY